MTSKHDIANPWPRTARADVRAWDTRDPLPEEFARSWAAALSISCHAHFALDLAYLKWDAGRGHRSRALLVEDAGRCGLMVQRREGDRWISGWPWRWQALVCGADPGSPVGMTAADAAWLHAQVTLHANGERLVHYLPHPQPRGVRGWNAGATVIQAIAESDEDLYESMEPSKRRLVKRARRHDVSIEVAARPEDFRAFYDLQEESKRRRGMDGVRVPPEEPASGEGWREWELPWMWLLLARHRGRVVAGVGDGIHAGGSMQGRTAAASLEARREGVTVLLGFEELKRGRDLRHRWFNFGGDTPFKREISGRLGRRIRVFAWLGGGSGVWRASESALRGLRPALARWRRRAGLVRSWMLAGVSGLASLAQIGADLPAGG